MKRMKGVNNGYNMKQILYTSIFFVMILLLADPSARGADPKDSLGVRTIDNHHFVIHKVEAGETLYALSRRYRVDVNDIINANPGIDNSIKIGQEVRIPYENAPESAASGNDITHVVREGETLFAIARKYNVSVGDIKKWNSLRSNNLSIGEKLVIRVDRDTAVELNEKKEMRENNGKIIHIVNSGETLYSIAGRYDQSTTDIKDWNHMENNTLFIGQELIVGYTEEAGRSPVIANELKVGDPKKEEVKVKKQEIEEKPVVENDNNSSDTKKITQKGIARVIEGSETTKKYLALHRTAPIGTIMQVRNEMNDLTVFVRVIGKLPDTGDNKNLLLKISKTAYDRLGVSADQFPVEIIYHP